MVASNGILDRLYKAAVILIPVLILAFIGYLIYEEETNPRVCVESSAIVEIVSVDRRSATIRLENGQLHTLDQSTVKPGDMFCLRYDRKNGEKDE